MPALAAVSPNLETGPKADIRTCTAQASITGRGHTLDKSSPDALIETPDALFLIQIFRCGAERGAMAILIIHNGSKRLCHRLDSRLCLR